MPRPTRKPSASFTQKWKAIKQINLSPDVEQVYVKYAEELLARAMERCRAYKEAGMNSGPVIALLPFAYERIAKDQLSAYEDRWGTGEEYLNRLRIRREKLLALNPAVKPRPLLFALTAEPFAQRYEISVTSQMRQVAFTFLKKCGIIASRYEYKTNFDITTDTGIANAVKWLLKMNVNLWRGMTAALLSENFDIWNEKEAAINTLAVYARARYRLRGVTAKALSISSADSKAQDVEKAYETEACILLSESRNTLTADDMHSLPGRIQYGIRKQSGFDIPPITFLSGTHKTPSRAQTERYLKHKQAQELVNAAEAAFSHGKISKKVLAYWLNEAAGCKQQEIARKYGVSLQTIKNTFRNTGAKVAEHLPDDHPRAKRFQ